MMKKTLIILALCLFAAACGSDEATGGCPADTPATCGNGQIDFMEMCDQGDQANGVPANFGSNSCATATGNPAATGSLTCQCCMIGIDMCVSGPVGGTGG